MIPRFTLDGVLPSGIHEATLKEIESRFGRNNARRKKLFLGLKKALDNLSKAGVKTVYINGSFVTSEPEPNDIDGCWEPIGVAVDDLDPVFLDFSNKRMAMKGKYGVDFFIANDMEFGSGLTFQEFFQTSRDGLSKGIIRIQLQSGGKRK